MIVLLQEEVMAGLNMRGREEANGRLLQKMDGKVKLEDFLKALRRIGNNELADKIEGMMLLFMMTVYVAPILVILRSYYGTHISEIICNLSTIAIEQP